ncbi:6-phosphofructokinase, partial [Bacteroidota bacterium]
TSQDIKQTLENKLDEDCRITILGHFQRGGAPSAFDRYMSTVLGYHAVDHILNSPDDEESMLIGMRRNKVQSVSLMDSVKKTHSIYDCISNGEYDKAIELRGGSFREALTTFRTLRQASTKIRKEGEKLLKIGLLNTSGPAPGMNITNRTAVRLAMDQGHEIIGFKNGYEGLIHDQYMNLDWDSVEEWTSLGGTVLGTNRLAPSEGDYYPIATNLDKHEIDGLLVIGGFSGYEATYNLMNNRDKYSAFNIPMIVVPASINNNLPGSDFSIGADTALNSIVEAVDKIKESAVASNRTFVVEVMGRYCGYLALMSGLATGAEKVYLNEHGITLKGMMEDVTLLTEGFKSGKHLALVIRSEFANEIYTTNFMSSLFEEDGGDVFDVRTSILGHIQQGGDPSPFDRNIGTRFATKSINELIKHANNGEKDCAFIGIHNGQMTFTDLFEFPRMIDKQLSRPKEQWWLKLRDIGYVFEKFYPEPEKANFFK